MSGWLSSGWDRQTGLVRDTRETDALGRSKTGTPDIGLSLSRKGSGETRPPNITQHPPYYLLGRPPPLVRENQGW